MTEQPGFWEGMPSRLRVRLILGLVFLGFAGFVFSQAAILGVVLLTLPILWTVGVIWIGSEDGMNFGPHTRSRNTAFEYTLRFFWRTRPVARIACTAILMCIAVGGLGWLSTENMRAEFARPTLRQQADSVAKSVVDVAQEKATTWVSTARGWLTGETDEN